MIPIEGPETIAPFPSGDNIEDYKEWHLWSNHRFAWEFLRRNMEFQQQCDQFIEQPSPAARRDIRGKFGLIRYKHYQEEYGETKKQRPKFVTSDVVIWPRVSEKIYKKIKPNFPKGLRPGQVLVRFDFNLLSEASSGISAMLEATDALLKRAAEIWLKEQGKTIISRRIREELLPLLRLLDLDRNRATTKLNREQMFEIVYGNGQTEKQIDDLSRVVRKKLATAKRYRDSDYLRLAATKKRATK